MSAPREPAIDGDDRLVFAEEPARPPTPAPAPAPWIALVVDDDPSVHEITALALDGFELDGRGLAFVSAFSAAEARELLARRPPELALIIVDVVMEAEDAGLGLITHIRDELGDRLVRILLRTGQAGRAPERRVIVEHDISDYKTKVELTADRLHTAVVAALRTFRHLRELDRLRDEAEQVSRSLGRFFPEAFLRLLGKPSITELRLGDQLLRRMTVMFADLRGFTARSERLRPEACFAFVNRVFGELGPLIREGGGYIDKFLGDGFLAIFPGAADDAIAAAVAIQRRLRELSASEGESIRIGVGLHSGEVMVGTVGEEERMEVTVLSSEVNLAARVEALTKRYGADVILTEETRRAATPGRWSLRPLGEARAAGQTRSTALFELLDAEPAELQARKRATADDFVAALGHLQAGDDAAALGRLEQVLARDPDDAAARYLRERALGRG